MTKPKKRPKTQQLILDALEHGYRLKHGVTTVDLKFGYVLQPPDGGQSLTLNRKALQRLADQDLVEIDLNLTTDAARVGQELVALAAQLAVPCGGLPGTGWRAADDDEATGDDDEAIAGAYARFVERNDHEGETWRFYIPIEGNEKALEELSALLDTAGYPDEDYPTYELDGPEQGYERTPDEVAILVAAADEDGYMASDQALSGKLDRNKIKSLIKAAEEALEPHVPVDEVLYKGGIRKLFVGADEGEDGGEND